MKSAGKRFCSGLFVILFACAAGVQGGTGYQGITVTEGGTISGIVRFSGSIQNVPELKISKDEKWCGPVKRSPRVVGHNGGLANAVVSLESIGRGKRWNDSSKGLLTQAACEFQPHIVLLPAGSALDIVNEDPLLHNVRTSDRKGKTVFNIAQPVKGQRFSVKPEKFSGPGIYEVSCDAGHPWMSAHIVVMEHPYVVITDEHGRFELKDVPEGTYRLRMWHEGIAILNSSPNGSYRYEEAYEEVREVKVTSNRTSKVDFAVTPRTPEAGNRRRETGDRKRDG